jgi:hypothetical protein
VNFYFLFIYLLSSNGGTFLVLFREHAVYLDAVLISGCVLHVEEVSLYISSQTGLLITIRTIDAWKADRD